MTQHLKRGTFHVLHWLFEGDTLTPAVGVLLYLLVWFLPVLKLGVDSGIDANVWHALGWMPNGISAAIFIPLAIYQVVCCRLCICHWWSRIVTSVLVATFVTYTTVAPAYVLWVKTSAFPEYYAGSAMVIFSCVVLVARNLRRDDDGGRPA